MARVLVVGGGGREHALAWRLAASEAVERVLVAPGNAGTALEAGCENHPVSVDDHEALVGLAHREHVDLVVVGPEAPLVDGLVDRCAAAGIAAFGPVAAAARLEGSKQACKEFLRANRIPTAASVAVTSLAEGRAHLADFDTPPVVKASGLAAGKGVVVAETHAEAEAALEAAFVERRFGAAGDVVLLEERLEGTEVSVLAFCDGERFAVMPPAQDHKRLADGDRGPNTGGMGAFVPSPVAGPALVEEVSRRVIAPTLAALAAEGTPYRGVLYAGLMLTAEGPRVLEFNCRFGDPETQVVLPLLVSDPVEVFRACVEGRLDPSSVRWSPQAAVTVVMASAGYPASSSPPVPISGLEEARARGCTVFHAGTRLVDGVVHTAGGRVLAVTALGPDLTTAATTAYAGVAAISFPGEQHRTDIARAGERV
ncbi:MAG: phosphoribosylamine--glycine ligase [Actinomyces sp.]|nr:MAG: phosphoribosylamine--glycine ligase [Actinomyces sp.]